MEELDGFLPDEYWEDVKSKIKYNSSVADLYDEFAYLLSEESQQLFIDRADDLVDVSSDGELMHHYVSMGYDSDEGELDYQAVSLKKKSRRISTCMSSWTSDYYRFQGTKDIKRVVLCKDKFCYNCQSMLAQKRYQKYVPQLHKLADDYQLLHIVFTVPNPSWSMLSGTVDQMYRAFPHLIDFFKGKKLIAGLDFSRFGYVGAVRALEVTYNRSDKTFHPHFHCIFVMDKNYDFTVGKHRNKFSYDRQKGSDYFFSDFEILLQKIWYLLFNKKRVTLQNINDLDEGYDLFVCSAEGHYHECFKYATKGIFKEGLFDKLNDESNGIFQVLQPCMDHRRIIQGYGCLHHWTDSDVEILEEDFNNWYLDRIASMQAIEMPYEVKEDFKTVFDANKHGIKYMSKYNLKKQWLAYREKEDSDNE